MKSITLEYLLQQAIEENKKALYMPDINEGEIAYISGYIDALEDVLDELRGLNNEDTGSVFKVCLN